MGINRRFVWRILNLGRWPRILAAIAGLCGLLIAESVSAQDIFRCDVDGKVTYSSALSQDPRCKRITFLNTEPNPDEVARLLDEKARRQTEEMANEEQARQDALLQAERRAAQARELEANAARQRAQAAEEELRLMKSGQLGTNVSPYGLYYPGISVLPAGIPRHGSRLPVAPPSAQYPNPAIPMPLPSTEGSGIVGRRPPGGGITVRQR